MQDSPKPADKPDSQGKRVTGGGGVSVSTVAMSGFEFAAAILLGFFVGRWLDGKFAITPWGVFGGVGIGAVAGFFSMYRRLMSAQRADEQHRP